MQVSRLPIVFLGCADTRMGKCWLLLTGSALIFAALYSYVLEGCALRFACCILEIMNKLHILIHSQCQWPGRKAVVKICTIADQPGQELLVEKLLKCNERQVHRQILSIRSVDNMCHYELQFI